MLSGADVDSIKRLTSRKVHLLSGMCLLMVGTNDIIVGTPLNDFRAKLSALVNMLSTKCEVMLVTIPDTLFSQEKNSVIKSFNQTIKSFGTKRTVTILDFNSELKNYNPAIVLEHYYSNGKVDGIHINKFACSILGNMVEKHHSKRGEDK
uniref:SGNH hydrolase-type esterase domain-containing protein n=1 Tax=Cuerna arida TaxID=1464854 RepID=A0A1B6FFJ7_9HEMI